MTEMTNQICDGSRWGRAAAQCFSFRARALVWLGAAVFALGVLFLGTAAQSATLTVTVHDIRSEDGNLTLAVYGSPDSFEEFEDDVVTRKLDATSGTVTVTFYNLPPGEYAVAAFHDENGNDDFDTNFFGLPEEGYGFSNDAPVVLGPPSFDDAAVEVKVQGTTQLSLMY